MSLSNSKYQQMDSAEMAKTSGGKVIGYDYYDEVYSRDGGCEYYVHIQ